MKYKFWNFDNWADMQDWVNDQCKKSSWNTWRLHSFTETKDGYTVCLEQPA